MFVCPWYLHTANSPWVLPRAERPSALKGCVETIKDGYIQKLPLSRVPRIQSTSHMCYTHDTCYSEHVTRIPTWSDLVRSLAGLGWSTLQPFSLLLV